MKNFKESVAHLCSKEGLKKQVSVAQMSELVRILINDRKFLLNLLYLSLRKTNEG